MVGVVGILLLGSLAWSAVGALVSAVGAAGAALTSAAAPRPVATFETVIAVTPTAVALANANAPTLVDFTPTTSATPVGTATPVVAMATPTPDVAVSPSPTVVLEAAGRNPWILLPQPQPGAKVAPGTVTVEARGRGDAPITGIGLELDGSVLPVQLEQRSESTWRGVANVHVGAGSHSVRATVTDAEGRTGSFRWSFSAGSGP